MRGVLRGAARSLLVTPWFAAGAGFVLAAGLWIYSPHTELRFPGANAPYGVPCTTQQCGAGPGGGQLATSTPGERIRHPAGHGRSVHTGATGPNSAASELTFTFVVAWQENDSFQALITVRGKHVPSTWRLEFTMPGARIRYVIGAQWRASPRGDGGTAFGSQRQFGGGGPGNSQEYGQDNEDYGQNPGGHRAQDDSIILLVMGRGSPSTPTNCVFNGSSCAFN
jgi:hypothetical protein